jgi:cation transport regulator
MPYRSNADLPPAVRRHLPGPAQTIYREAFNGAWRQYVEQQHRDEAVCHRIAWAAVKRQYRKVGDDWVRG